MFENEKFKKVLEKSKTVIISLFDKLNCGCKTLFSVFKRVCQFVGKHYYLFLAGGFISVAKLIISSAARYFSAGNHQRITSKRDQDLEQVKSRDTERVSYLEKHGYNIDR